jgi:hypothetical protein
MRDTEEAHVMRLLGSDEATIDDSAWHGVASYWPSYGRACWYPTGRAHTEHGTSA